MRYVFDFDEDSDGGRELLGGKGIGLAEMTQLGVPVPAGFTITTEACRAYMAAGGAVPDGLDLGSSALVGGTLRLRGVQFPGAHQWVRGLGESRRAGDDDECRRCEKPVNGQSESFCCTRFLRV